MNEEISPSTSGKPRPGRGKTLSEGKVVARHAQPPDIDAIYSLGVSDSTFEVSHTIRFYEKSEIEEWVRERQSNLILVAEFNNRIVGFLFCKIMSHHWAMLDNFYIAPRDRGKGSTEALSSLLLSELRQRKLSYLSCLVREDHKPLERFLNRRGFKAQDKYTWLDYFIVE